MSIVTLFRKKYIPLNTVEIAEKNLVENYSYLTQMSSGKKIAPVLKSNAYGHGISLIANILDHLQAPFFCVDSIYEGYQLLKANIRTPILIMGYVNPENLRVKKLPFSFAVYEYEMLEGIKKYQPHAGVHIFVDTGLHREGVSLEELPIFIKKTQSLSLKIEGLMSHFGMANQPRKKETKEQVTNFLKAQKILHTLGVNPTYIHLPASLGILYNKEYQTLSNVARAGIALYGIDPEGRDKNLLPVLKLRSTIVQIKIVKKGEKIGYDFTFTATKDMTIAVLPIGYNDGVDRRLSNKGYVQVRGIYCRIIGKVSMNITTIDITDIKQAEIGDEAVIFSSQSNDKNSIVNASKICDVIPYELLVHIHPTTKRVINR